MKCFYHEDREAAATCQRCGKGLCRECAAKYTPCLCDECFAALQQEAHAQRVAAAEGRRQSRLEQRGNRVAVLGNRSGSSGRAAGKTGL